MEQLTILLSYSLSVYGIAWILTKSRLFLFIREPMQKMAINLNSIHEEAAQIVAKKNNPLKYYATKIAKFVSAEKTYFLNCIVCTSVWVSFTMLLFVKEIAFLEYHIIVNGIPDFVFLMGFSVSTTWLIASSFGDAT